MDTPLTASSTTAGALMSASRFAIPQFQREYAWTTEEVEEFWGDLRRGLDEDSYFLGLIILTGTGSKVDVVDGQQRLLTLTLLAAALYHEAMAADRPALAERIQSTFLRAIDFESDEELPRITLSGTQDRKTLKDILEHPASEFTAEMLSAESVSGQLIGAYRVLALRLDDDLKDDRFKRLGVWAEFLTNRLYLVHFVHPDQASAYKVFEVVNTRGKELTTADLLKSYILSQTAKGRQKERYQNWQAISGQFPASNPALLVQFIRHAVTVRRGHVPPKDLYDVLTAQGGPPTHRLSPDAFMDLLNSSLPLYLQMIDPTNDGPSVPDQLGIFSALNRLGVISVRPILLAMAGTDNATEGMRELLRLVVRRVVVGNLGTGNVERRFGQAAQKIYDDRSWGGALAALGDLNPSQEDFETQLHRRSLNGNVLAFLRQSIIQRSATPDPQGFLHLIMPRQADWPSFAPEVASYWASTIGNTVLIRQERRPQMTNTWLGVVEHLLPLVVEGEWTNRIAASSPWDESAVSSLGHELAQVAGEVWYG